MTDKINKFLLKLSDKELRLVTEVVEKIVRNNMAGLNVKKLEGQANIFRVKKGDFRIIFLKDDLSINIISVNRRNEKTYRGY